MKKTLIKLDRLFLDQLTEYIKKWIEKNNYEKHKIDFMILLDRIQFGGMLIWVVLIPVIIFVLERQFVAAAVQGLIWSIVGGSTYFTTQKVNMDIKQSYDFLFSMRKNPIFYDMHKKVLEELFIANRKNRIQTILFLNFIHLFLAVFLILISFITHWARPDHFVGEYIVFSGMLSLVRMYILYVFDFDEPKPKEKEVRQSLTELMLQAWQNFIGGFSPLPQI